MTDSTIHMLNKMNLLNPETKSGKTGDQTLPIEQDSAEKQPKLAPAPEMANVLSNCLGQNKQHNNSPLK